MRQIVVAAVAAALIGAAAPTGALAQGAGPPDAYPENVDGPPMTTDGRMLADGEAPPPQDTDPTDIDAPVVNPPLPDGITATATAPTRSAAAIPSSRRFVSVRFQIISQRHIFYIRQWLHFSCHRGGTVVERTREGSRWVKRYTLYYQHCPTTGTEASQSQLELAHRPVDKRGTVRLRLTFAEQGKRPTVTTLTMRRTPAPGHAAQLAANRWWTEPKATCQRSGSGTGAGQMVVDVDPASTFGLPLYSTIEWESLAYVYDTSKPAGQRYYWLAHPAGFFSYMAGTSDSGSSPIIPLSGGGGVWYSGGSNAPDISGNQTWFFHAGLYVLPALVIRYHDWNFVPLWDVQPPGIKYGDWCHFY